MSDNASWEGAFVPLPGGGMFVDGVPPDHEHVFDGPGILDFWNDDRIMKESDYQALPDEEKEKLNIKTGQVTCSICGAAWFDCNNPFLMF